MIKIIDIDKCIEEFNNYVKNFNMKNEKIKQRYDHTFRVMNNCENIAKNLNLTEEDILLAKLIGLLHDIGRFYQLETYGTVNDKKTIDHGNYGAEILFNDNYIEAYTKNTDDYEIIRKSIINHNKLVIDNNLNERELLFANIIRDADKTDILYIISEYHELNFNFDEITPNAKEDFYKQITIPYKDINSNSDRVFIYLCYIFDINFNYSLKKIKNEKLYERIYDTLDQKENFKEYFDYIYKYIDERMIKC